MVKGIAKIGNEIFVNCGLLILEMALLTVSTGENDQRHRHSPCKVLLNEILFAGPQGNFIEIAKLCPGKGKQNRNKGLDGFIVTIVKAHKDFEVVFYTTLDSLELVEPITESSSSGALNPSTSTDPSVGTRSTTPTLLHEGVRHIPQDPSRSLRNYQVRPHLPEDESRSLRHHHGDESRSLRKTHGRHERSMENNRENYEEDAYLTMKPKVDCKLSRNSSKITAALRVRRVPRKPENVQAITKYLLAIDVPEFGKHDADIIIVALIHYRGKNKPGQLQGKLDARQLTDIGAHTKDVVFINGHATPENIASINAAFLNEFSAEKIITYPNQNPGVPIKSINKCDDSIIEFTKSGCQLSPPTKMKINICTGRPDFVPVYSEKPAYPYAFAGQTIGTYGQKIIVNLLWALKQFKTDAGLFRKSEREITSKLVNLHESTIKKIENKHNKQEIGLATKRKPYPKPVMDCIDGEKKLLLQDIISSYYKNNKIPTIEHVKNKFVTEMRKLDLHADRVPKGKESIFSCGIDTFRKILHASGYTWSTINKRDGVLYDPRIIRLRGRYLDVIRSHDELGEHKLPVLFTDETWFDAHSRGKKGWVRKGCLTWAEKQAFTFLNSKQSRGPRIIIVHVGGENGFIHELMEVYPVTSKVADDYHANVHGKKYIDWFERLMLHLKDKGTHLIVMDNAPYHSVHDAPRLSARKDVLKEWLEAQRAHRNDIPDLTNMLRIQLESIVRKIKQEEPQYVIDNMAHKYGQKIVRLAPYNCDLNPIEYVWSDVKRQLREQNVDQNDRMNVLRAKTIMSTYSKESWQSHIRHVKKLEEKYWQGDLEFERALEANEEFQEAECAMPVEHGVDDESSPESSDSEF